MSTHSPSTHTGAESVRRAAELVRNPLETVAFWSAIALPFCYLPLLYTGVDGTEGVLTLAALLVAHVAALFVGHDHNRDD